MQTFYWVCALLLFIAQVKTEFPVLENEETIQDFVKSWGLETKDFVKELIELQTNQETQLVNKIANSEFLVGPPFILALQKLDSLKENISPECYQQGLLELKKASVFQFINCHRLKTGFNDISAMLSDTFNVSVKLAGYVKDLFDIFHCTSGDKMKDSWCLMKYMWKVNLNSQDVLPLFTDYGAEIARLAKEIKDIYNYCTHDHTVDKQVNTILQQTELCTLGQSNL
ncbi:uncharacterized protein [Rhodnius prolixus]|uniref:uncharacterized protein n=1 Tax=Rhodnius prolixus TaxID=13249 RepID=UPI003D18CE2A